MKRFTVLTLVLVMLCASLASCKAKLFDPVNADTTVAETTAALKADDDYDEAGSIILTSSENRKVYKEKDSFIIFSFLGNSVKSVTRVWELSSKTEAEEYLREYALTFVEKGEVPPTMKVNGVYVIASVGFSNEKGTDGFYYTMSREQITNEMANSGAELK